MSARDGGDLERRISTLEKAQKEFADAMLVHAVLEFKSAARLKEHPEIIATHEAFHQRHEIKMAEFDDKLNALIDIIMKRNGGPETPRV